MPLMLFPLPQSTLPVLGEQALFPVRRIYCVGRNYAEHAREMGHDPALESPFFFSKPADAVVNGPAAVAYPPATTDLQHEVELVVALHGGGAATWTVRRRAPAFSATASGWT